MPSIIEGYNYDLFISYRQKDNKGDKWVSKFAEALKTELESTFKEEISVYFDINPHDGLLETHDVDASLKEKLKCLVFIPIISRTYCDPKSFAWEHEFKAFLDLTSRDQFGLKIKLPNGNIASRVLPVLIHDLETADIKECESVLGGVLRGIEFIYKEPGVNKPLTSDDDDKKNLNNTKYIIQINKIANAIKEIISGLKTEPFQTKNEKSRQNDLSIELKTEENQVEKKKPSGSNKRMLFYVVGVLAILIFTIIFAFPKIFKRNTLERQRSSGGKISIAVMPIQNMTNDTVWNVWQNGMQDMLIASLSNSSDELIVRQAESINNLIKSRGLTDYTSITPSIARLISQKLNADVFIYGNIKQAGSKIRVYAQLIDSKSEEVFKSYQIEGGTKEENIFQVIDSLSTIIKDFLIVSKLEKNLSIDLNEYLSTNSPKAYRFFALAENSYLKLDYYTAEEFYLKALKADSNFTLATVRLSLTYFDNAQYKEAKKWCLKAYKKRNQMPVQQQLYTNYLYALCFDDPHEAIKYLEQLLQIDDQLPAIHWRIGVSYNRLFQYNNAIPEFEKALEIYNKWDLKPVWAYNYTDLGEAYHKTGQFKKERALYKKAEKDFPGYPILLYRQTALAFTEGDSINANRYIKKFRSYLADNSISEAEISMNVAMFYLEANVLDKAEEYFRKVISEMPDNAPVINALAWLLINQDRNVDEGMELVDKALKLSPNDCDYLDTKGWGLYKKGQYQLAMEMLQKSWDIRMKDAIYSQESFDHLEAAKKAVTSQKNN
jgi:tetratricopeptide (TPR) repeat protein